VADLYYIDDDYYAPDGYFTYTADAASAIAATATVTCSAGKIVQAVIAQVTLFNTGVTAFVTSSASINLNTAATVSTVANRNRSTDIALSNIVTLSAQAAKFKGTAVSLNSSATVAAAAVEYESYIATSPTPFYATGQALISTTQTHFGSHSLFLPDASAGATTASLQSKFAIGTTDNFSIAFWYYPTANSAGTYDDIISWYDGSTGWAVQRLTTRGIRFFIDGETDQTGGVVLTLNAWNWVVVTRTGTTLEIYVNGTQEAIDTTHAGGTTSTARYLKIGDIGSGGAVGYLDGVHITIGGTISTAVPTTDTVGGTASTKLLMNWNGTWYDQSLSALESGAAALTSTATLFAQPVAGQTKTATAALNSAATVSAAVTRIKQASIAISSQSNVVATVSLIKQASIAISSQGFVVTINDHLDLAAATIVTAATVAVSAKRLRNVSQNLSVSATVAVTAVVVPPNIAHLASAATLTANVIVVPATTVYLNSAAALTANARNLVGFGWDNIRSLLKFDNNLLDSVTGTTASGSVSSYITSATNFSQAALDPRNVAVSRTTGTGITTIGTQEFSYDVKLKAAPNAGYNTGLYSGILVEFVDANNTDIIYQLEYEEGTGTTFDLKLTEARVTSSSRTTIVTNTFTSPQDSGDINYTPWLHIKLIRKSGVVYFYVNGVQRTNTGTFTANLTSSITVARDLYRAGAPLPFVGKIDESCLRIGGDYSTADFTPPARPYNFIDFAYADLNSNFTQTSQLDRIRRTTSTSTVTTTLNVTAVKIQGPFIKTDLVANITQSTQARKTARVQSLINSQSLLSVTNTRARLFSAAIQTAASQVTNGRRIRYGNSAIVSTATVNATAGKLVFVTANLPAIATELTIAVKTGRTLIDISSQATLTCNAFKTVRPSIASTTAVSQSTSFLKLPQPREYSFALTVNSALTASGRRNRLANANLSAAFTQTTNAIGLFVNTFLLTANATVTASPVAGKIAIINSDITATVTAINRRIRKTECHMVAFNTQVTAGTKLTLDPYYQLIVPREISVKKISKETAIIVVDSENRLNTVQVETLTLTVPKETSTWHIPYAPVVGIRRVK
jgi:hypothetical protein